MRWLVVLVMLVIGCSDDSPPSFDGQWVVGSHHIIDELPGEEPAILIQQITFIDGGAVELQYASCAGETLSQGTWTAIADGEVEVRPIEGEDRLSLGGEFAKLRATALDAGIRVQFTGLSGVDLGIMDFAAGRVCLNCSNVGFDQAYECSAD
jgi:hypothetical protein